MNQVRPPMLRASLVGFLVMTMGSPAGFWAWSPAVSAAGAGVAAVPASSWGISTRFHSRFNGVRASDYFRPVPSAELHPLDAQTLGIRQGDAILVTTPTGTMRVHAELTKAAKRGTVFMFQSYADEADVNRIIDGNHLDPYSGFPGYRTVRCKVEEEQAV